MVPTCAFWWRVIPVWSFEWYSENNDKVGNEFGKLLFGIRRKNGLTRVLVFGLTIVNYINRHIISGAGVPLSYESWEFVFAKYNAGNRITLNFNGNISKQKIQLPWAWRVIRVWPEWCLENNDLFDNEFRELHKRKYGSTLIVVWCWAKFYHSYQEPSGCFI